MMCDAVKQKLPPAPKPGFFASLFGLGQEDPFTAEYRAKWTRPFEEVVADWFVRSVGRYAKLTVKELLQGKI